jgi:hypothetical protein
MKNWRIIELIAFSIAAVAFLTAVFLSMYDAYVGPSVPEPSVGRVYLHQVHKYIAYITYEQKLTINILFGVAILSLIVAVTVDRWKQPFLRR